MKLFSKAVRIEEADTSVAGALVSNREIKHGIIKALIVSSRSGPRYLIDRASFSCLFVASGVCLAAWLLLRL
jgi:hypothetical protein